MFARHSLSVVAFALVSLCASLLTTHTAQACDTCGMSSAMQLPGTVNATRSVGLQEGGWTASFAQQVSRFKTRGDSALRTADTDLELVKTFSTSQLSASYNLTSELGVQLALPIIVREYDHFVNFRRQRGTDSGLGDMTSLMTYSPYSQNTPEERTFLLFFGGLKLPTGDTGSLKRVVDSAEVAGGDPSTSLQGRGLALGSGSVDVPFGFTVYHREDRLFALLIAQHTFRNEGEADYRFANDTSWSATPGYLFLLNDDNNLSLGMTVSGEHKGNDRLAGITLDRTSVNNIYVGPEVLFSWQNRLTAQAAIDLPVAVDVGGAAVEPDFRVRASLNWIF